MDDKVVVALRISINLHKMITPTQRTERSLQALMALQGTQATQRFKLRERLDNLPGHIHTAGNIAVHDIIKCGEIRLLPAKRHREHATTDVHPHDVGNDFIAQVSRKADDTALARMHIGHDSHLRARRKFVIAHSANLLYGFLFDDGSIANSCIYYFLSKKDKSSTEKDVEVRIFQGSEMKFSLEEVKQIRKHLRELSLISKEYIKVMSYRDYYISRLDEQRELERIYRAPEVSQDFYQLLSGMNVGALKHTLASPEVYQSLLQTMHKYRIHHIPAGFKEILESEYTDFEDIEEPYVLLEMIAAKRGMLLRKGEYDTERAAVMLLDEYRGGKLGRITLETPPER